MPDSPANDPQQSQPTVSSDPLDTLRDSAAEMAEIARDLGLRELAASIEADQQRRLGDQRLRVMVLGEIKHGKSSLINALAGASLLPVGVTPTTGRVVSVRSGPVSGRFVAATGGDHAESVDEERFGRLVRGKEEVPEARLEVQVAGGALPDTLELVDTPGLNDIDRFRSAASRGELPRADVLVLVLDATQVLTRTELEALRDALTAVGGLERSGARLEVVINRIDLVSPADRDVVVGHLREQLATLIGADVEPFLTDAKRASAQADASDGDDAGLGVAEVERLRARLEALAESRDEILPARMRSSLRMHARGLRYNALIQARAVTLDTDRLDAEVEAVKAAVRDHAYDLAKLRETLRRGRQAIIDASVARSEEFRRALQADALGQVDGADLRNLTDLLPGAIQAAFLDFSRQEARRIREALEQLTDQAIRTHGEQARRRLRDASLRLGFAGPSIYVEPPSVIIEAGMIALGIAGTAVMYFGSMVTGMVMTIASPLATMLLRERSVRDARAQARQIIPTALARAESALGDTVRRAVERYIERLDAHLVNAAEGVGEQLVATLDRARERLVAHAESVAAELERAAQDSAGGEGPTEGSTETSKGPDGRGDGDGDGDDERASDVDDATAAKQEAEDVAESDARAGDDRPRAARPSSPEHGEPVEIADPVAAGGVKIDPKVAAEQRRARLVAERATADLRAVEARLAALQRRLDALRLDGEDERRHSA